MALLLSTVDGGKITGMQARAFHQSASQGRDVIFKKYGNAFATPAPVGFTAVVGTGMLVSDGVICENTENLSVSMPVPTKNGNGLLLAVVDAGKKTFSFEMQPHANGILKNDLVEMPNGVRKIPLYFFQYTTSAIVSWSDWRTFGETSGMPIGTVVQFSGTTVPEGWLLCDGSKQFQVRYKELFEVIGTTYNNPSTKPGEFNLPDYRGNVPVGLFGSDGDFNRLGKTGGEKSHVLTGDELPKHRVYADGMSSGPYYDNAISPTFISPGNTYGLAIPNIGKNVAHNNLQPYITTNFIIKY